jgi:hypothetical protein
MDRERNVKKAAGWAALSEDYSRGRNLSRV